MILKLLLKRVTLIERIAIYGCNKKQLAQQICITVLG
jgi:hypothetical protein